MTKFQLIFASPPTPVPIEAASVQLTRGNVGLGGAGGGTSRRLPLSTSSNPSIMASIPLNAITVAALQFLKIEGPVDYILFGPAGCLTITSIVSLEDTEELWGYFLYILVCVLRY